MKRTNNPEGNPPLSRAFFDRPSKRVARDLLGCALVHEHPMGRRVGTIVETEVYDGFDDRASHASGKRTRRNDVMFGPPGHSYIYLIYGMHHCLNVVTREEDYPAAILIRALEPVEGIELGTNGPGRLCKAMGLDLSHNRQDITGGSLYFSARTGRAPKIVASARIGVDYAGEWADRPLRFLVDGNPFVSRPAVVKQKKLKI